MDITKDININNKKRRILVSVSAFLLLYFIAYLLDPYSDFWTNFFNRRYIYIISDWIESFVFCFLASESSIYINKSLNKYIPWPDYPGKRFIVETVINLISVLLILLIVDIICVFFIGEEQFPGISNNILEYKRGYIQWIVVSVLTGLIIVGINMGCYLYNNWKNTLIKAAKLDQHVIQAELEALKLQMDPHFVFNNLSILSELILKNQQLGYDYADNFTRIYKYMLVNSKNDVITLEEEMKFLNSYMFLIKHRFEEGVNFIINVNASCKMLYIPPLTLQILMENILKHNRTNKKCPLQIRIYNNDEDELIVENTLLPITNKIVSSKIGIQNVIRRYSYISAKVPRILKNESEFKVILPLLKYDK